MELFEILPQVTMPRSDDNSEIITVYRGINGTNPGAFRVDPDGVSTFEIPPPGFAFIVAFRVRYDRPKVQGKEGFLIDPELQGGTATYTPQHGGEGHWSLNFPGNSTEEIKKLLSEFAKK